MLIHPQGAEAPDQAAPHAAASIGIAGAASVAADAVAPAGLNQQKESAPAAKAAQSREQTQRLNSAIDGSANKPFFTLRAQLALKGYALHRTHFDDGPVRFYVTQRGQVHELASFEAVCAFAVQMGASHD